MKMAHQVGCDVLLQHWWLRCSRRTTMPGALCSRSWPTSSGLRGRIKPRSWSLCWPRLQTCAGVLRALSLHGYGVPGYVHSVARYDVMARSLLGFRALPRNG